MYTCILMYTFILYIVIYFIYSDVYIDIYIYVYAYICVYNYVCVSAVWGIITKQCIHKYV